MRPTKSSVLKPAAPIRQKLRAVWLAWLLWRLFAVPFLAVGAADTLGAGVLWQLIVLIPALIFTPAILRGRSPYALLLANMLMLAYLANAGVQFFTHAFSGAGNAWGFAAEFMLLLLVNIWLFVLLKRLPPMYKQRSS
ncbi:hypothetical protein B0181_08435 [Moraxella caviae]|uniref:DUF2069 domain-containing protein n=1 Tax=Moraxella caviae TaxID=34060 RepID=A0A1S9ZXV5_9GAMM|nr:hypothetical protein [Moraxella caviae]OOR88259.1 hypothetical protein B0181_08435 [Moraxella caviae]STZ13906.1 Uncharacterised protein [Moraxella caviae]